MGKEFNFTFDPDAVLTLNDKLTLYEGDLQVTDEWGRLKTTEGALFVRESAGIVRVQVPVPANAGKAPLVGTVSGKGWTLELKPSWKVTPDSRGGDFTVRPEAKP